MVLEWNRFSWLPKGIDQYDTRLSVSPDTEEVPSLVANNFVNRSSGLFYKRNGIRKLVEASSSISGPKRIASGKDELCIIDDHHLHSLDVRSLALRKKGLVSPGSLKQTVLDASEEVQNVSDVAGVVDSSGNEMLCIVSLYGALAGGSPEGLTFTVVGREGARVYGPFIIPTSGLVDFQAIGVGQYVFVVFTDGTNVRFWRWDSDSPTADPSLQRTQGNVGDSWDVFTWDNENYIFSWIDTVSGDVKLQAYTTGGSAVFATAGTASSNSGDYTKTSIAKDEVNGRVIWVTSAYTGAGSTLIVASTRRYATGFAQEVAEFNVLAATTPSALKGVVGASRFPAIRGVVAVDRTEYFSFLLSNGTMDNSGNNTTLVNAEMIHRPWYHNGRWYAACIDTMGTLQDIPSCNWLLDLNINDELDQGPTGEGTNRVWLPRMVGLWNVLSANVSSVEVLGFWGKTPYINGSLCTFTNQFFTSKPIGQTASSSSWRLNTGVTEIDFAYKPQAVKSIREGILCTGSLLVWYDGQHTQELGFSTCPHVEEVETISGATAGPDDVTIQTMWSYLDALGLLHRSYTSAIVSKELNDHTGYTVTVSGHNSTMRDGLVQRPRFMLYRTYNSSRLKLVSDAFNGPIKTNNHTQNSTVIDTVPPGIDSATEEPYTIDGLDLPNISPGGCRFATMTPDRLWIAGLSRGSELQASDPIRSTTGATPAPAPEFHPSFTTVGPDDSEFTGIGNLQGKVIVFSERSVFGVEGRGPDISGASNEFSTLITLSNEFGCVNSESVVECPSGILFQCRQGVGIVRQNLTVGFLGNVNNDLDQYTILDSCHFPELRCCVFLMNRAEDSLFHVYDYINDSWVTWTHAIKFVSLCYHDGALYLLSAAGDVFKYDTSSYTDTDAGGNDAWFKAALRTKWYNMDRTNSGWLSLRWASIEGLRDAESLSIRMDLYYDGTDTGSRNVTVPFSTINNKNPAGQLHYKFDSPRKKCRMFSVEVSDVEPITGASGGWGLHSIGFELGRNRGTYKTGART